MALLIGLLLCPVLLIAEEEAVRWYEVEVIIFTQNNNVYRDTEVWPLDYTLPDIATSVELSAASGVENSSLPAAFSRIPESRLRLRQEAERFRRAKDVELQLHLGWYQPGLPEDKAKAVHIASADRVDGQPRLDGTLRLILSRYLHLEADMVLREAMPAKAFDLPDYSMPPQQESGQESTPSPALAGNTAESMKTAAAQRYQIFHLTESRRMRSGEIHYLDHPLFGIVALVTPYESAQAASTAR